MSSTAVDVAAVVEAKSSNKTGGKKSARGKGTVAGKEDPRHTWNHQLMEACLQCDLPKVKELVERGADPVNAREAPPRSFYYGALGNALEAQQQQQRKDVHSTPDFQAAGGGVTNADGSTGFDTYGSSAAALAGDHVAAGHHPSSGPTSHADGTAAQASAADRLPPLVMMLLSGLDTPAAREVVAYLIQQGASVNDTFHFAAARHHVAAADIASAAAAGGRGKGSAGADGSGKAAGSRSISADAKKSIKKKASMVAANSRSNSLALAPATTVDAGNAAAAAATGGGVLKAGEVMVTGTVAHYVVCKGDHAQLLRLLLLAGPDAFPTAEAAGGEAGSTPVALPYALLTAVEQETVVGALRQHHLASLQHAAKSMSISKASAGVEGAGGQRGKGKPGSTSPATSAPVSPHHGGSSLSTSQGGAAPFVVSPAAAEAVLAALQQRLGGMHSSAQRAPTSGASAAAGGGGADNSGSAVDLRQRLPVLASAYPVMPETLSTEEGEAAVREMQLAAVVDTDAALHSLSATWWSLRKVCHKDSSAGVASAAAAAAAPPSNGSAADAASMPQLPSAAVAPLAQRIELNLSLVDSLGRFATSIALDRGDTLAFRLLHFFGATVPFAGLVNASQTRLARACASGDVALVERLLQQGDNVAQISADGRYTLVHYAAAQPEVLKLLVERGLSLEHQNALGESAVLSLLRYGTARNDAKYVASLHGQAAAAAAAVGGEAGAAPATAPGTNTHPVGAAANGQATTAATAAAVAAAPVSAAVRNAVAFTQLSPAAQRNYILCPPLQLPSMGPGATNTSASAAQGGGGGGGSAAVGGGGAAASRSATIKDRVTSASARRASATAAATATQSSFLSGTAAGGSGDVEQPFFGGREAGTWWSHLPPTSTTADVLDTLLKAGAVLQGYVPDEDLELPYVRFAEMQAAGGNDAGFPALGNRRNNSDDSAGHEAAQQLDDSDASRASLFTSTHTAVPGGPNRSNSRSYGTVLPHRPLPFPGRLPLRLTPLQQAILDYHPELIRRLVVDYRVDPTQRDSQGATALHYAALCTHAPSVLELLLSPQVMQMHVKSAAAAAGGMVGGGTQTNAASVANSGGTNSNNSGSAAATAEALISVSAAVNSKLDINCVDMAGRTPLFYAALVGNEAAVRLLLRFGSLAQVGRPDRDGWTPLHVAVRQQHPAVVEALLQHSSRLLSTAAAGNSDAAMELLNTPAGASAARRASLRAGGRRSSSRQRAGSFNSTGSARSRRSGSGTNGGGGSGGASGGGPAIAYGAASPTDYLYANGALSLVDVEAEERDGHMTPLELVVKSVTPYTPASAAQQRMVTALLAEGQASAMRPSGLESGGSLLHRVVADGQVELAELLLTYFADVDEADDNDETPLFLAVRQPHLKVERLDGTHAGRSDSSSSGGNDTSAYAQECRTALVRVLLQHGATPYAQSGVNLQTPLHLAASTLARPTEDAAEVMQMLFYTVPDRKAAAGRRGRLGSRSRDHRVLSRVLEAMDTDGDGAHRALGRSGAAGRRHGGGAGETAAGQRRRRNRSLLNSNGSVASGGRQPQGRLQEGGNGGGRRHQRWSGAGGNFSESEAAEATMEGDVSDALSLGNSSFASGGNHHHHTTHDDADDDVNDDRSAASSRLGSAEKGVGQPADSPSEERLAMSEADRRRAMLREWQSADHLLAPAHCWLLTNAHGQTPLHVLCSSACRAVQRNPVVWRLLADLQTATAERETADQEVLRMLWSLPDSEGRTPLHAAALSGFVEAMERILEVCPAAVAAVDAQGRTPLHVCVLMRGDASAPETGDDGSRDEAGAAQLHRLLRTLRDGFDAALSENSGRSGGGGGAAVPLQGLRMHHTNRDVLPTPRLASSTAPPSAVGGDGSATARRELAARGRATASLVQSSSITTQILRWQKTRHWGAPALMSAAADAATPAAAAATSAGMSAPTLHTPTNERHARLRGDEDAVCSWREYVQLPDGHGRTALLLAAEVGNRSAARELLRQA